MAMTEFLELGLSEETIKALEKKGFKKPTPIQKQAIPMLLDGDYDVVGQAQTGTGKTAAFGLPIIEKLENTDKKVQAIILTPTRELALQVADELNSLKGSKNLKIVAMYGGQPIDVQIRQLKKGVNVVVGTPGRIIDHLERGTLSLDSIKYFVLDEADEMLDMGFIDDIEDILSYTNKDKKVLLFSATLPRRIMGLAKKYMKKYKVISVKSENLTTEMVEQIYYEVRKTDKFEALCRVIDVNDNFYGIIFCKTRAEVNDVANKLCAKGYFAEGLHGDIAQNQREKILSRFKIKRTKILVATDVAARGIDVNDLTHVVNYDIPQNPEAYVHRIGRTGRAGKKGISITFVQPDEFRRLKDIMRTTKSKITKKDVPSIEEIKEIKKTKVIDKIYALIEKGDNEGYTELAEDLLKNNDNPIEVVASLLKYSFHDELNKKYGKIKQVRNIREPTSGQVRLFVAHGKRDGMNPKRLVTYLEEETGVRSRFIDDVLVLENFSYVTVSSRDGDKIIKSLGVNPRSGKPMAEKAKQRRD